MISRCTNQNYDRYADYGGRGITIEDVRWLKFSNFFNDMGERPKWGTIGRVDNDIGYSKFNCRWKIIINNI